MVRQRHIALALVALAASAVGAWWAGAPMTAAAPVRTAPLPGQPIAMVVEARTGRVFVAAANVSSLTAPGSISMLDAATGAVVRTVTVGVNPQVLAVSDATLRTFVVNAGYGSPRYTVSVLDARTGVVLRTVPVAAWRPVAITVDDRQRRVFILNAGPLNRTGAGVGRGSVSVLDGASGALVQTTEVGRNPSDLAVDGAAGRIVVVNSGATVMNAGSVSVLNAAAGHVIRTVPVGPGAGVVVVDARTGRAFVTTHAGIYVLDTRTGAVLRIVPAAGSALALDRATWTCSHDR